MVDVYAEKQKEADLRNELSTCLTSHWKYCVAGVALGMPIGIFLGRRRIGGAIGKHLPYIGGGFGGQVADWRTAEVDCQPFQDRLDEYLRKSKHANDSNLAK